MTLGHMDALVCAGFAFFVLWVAFVIYVSFMDQSKDER